MRGREAHAAGGETPQERRTYDGGNGETRVRDEEAPRRRGGDAGDNSRTVVPRGSGAVPRATPTFLPFSLPTRPIERIDRIDRIT
jgi:hypothetical protein